MSLDTLWLLLLLPAGFLAGVVNVLAGGGSFLTLPVLMAAGLPVEIANATNRISVILQGAYATLDYQKKGQFDAKLYRTLLPPIVAGALLGAYLATRIDPKELRHVFGAIFVAMALVLLLKKKFAKRTSRKLHPLRYPALMLIGVYGGFIQAGVGLWILLGSTALFGVDALKANTVKLPITLTFSVPALLIFLEAGMVRWVPGLVLALGTVIGTHVGVRWSLNKGGSSLILNTVTVVLLATGVHLLL